MHHARVMDGQQPLGQRGADGGDLRGGQRTGLVDLVVQRGPRDVLRGEPGAVRIEIGRHQPGRTAAADPPGGRDLPREPRAEFLILRQVRPDHLEGHPLPAFVRAEIDHAHSARAERRCSRNVPTTRGSSRRSRIIAMSVPYLRWGAPSAANRLTWHSLRIDGSLC